MKLLMITRKVDQNDALAGFTYNWVKKIGENLDKLYVISWQAGDNSGLPENVKIFFLPANRMTKVFTLQKLLFKILPQIDGVFCHMNPEYTILIGPLTKIFRKKIVSWYTHKAVTWRRHLMERLADIIVTASPESFRQPKYPAKVKVIGHGIDTEIFNILNRKSNNELFNIISVGRISPTKDYESIIKAVDIINIKKIKLKIIGDVILKSQQQYLNSLQQMVRAMDLFEQVEFVGWVANKNMPSYYQEADLFINMSGTGSVDKVMLEAMSCGSLVLTANEAFREIIGSEFMVSANNPHDLVKKIKWLMGLPAEEKIKIRKKLRQIVINDHQLNNLVQKIIKQF